MADLIRTEADLIERLEHFERNQLAIGDRYGAEVLRRAVERIRYLRAQLSEATE